MLCPVFEESYNKCFNILPRVHFDFFMHIESKILIPGSVQLNQAAKPTWKDATSTYCQPHEKSFKFIWLGKLNYLSQNILGFFLKLSSKSIHTLCTFSHDEQKLRIMW